MGFAAPGAGFDWDVAAVFGTAFGTTLLAVGTLALAYSTWQDVRASQRIAEATLRSLELTEEDREERLRPVLIGAVTSIGADAEGNFLSIEVHNIGGGPAVRIEVTGEYVGALSLTVGETRIAWLAPGGSFPLAVRLLGLPAPAADSWGGAVVNDELAAGDFRVRGGYLDRLGRPVPRSILDWLHDELPTPG